MASESGMPKIESGVPIPEVRFGRKGKWIEIIKDMKVGDSVSVPSWTEVNSLLVRAKSHGLVFTSRIQPDRSYRVWRVE